MSSNPPQLMNVKQAAAALGVTSSTVYRWVAQGRLPHRPESWGLCFTAEAWRR